MHGSIPTKLARLGFFLATHPWDIPRYVANLRKRPLDAQVPWFAFHANDFLSTWVLPSHKVFEYGFGGSSLWFAKRCATVTCAENDEQWLEQAHQTIQRRGTINLDVRYSPIESGHADEFAASPYVTELASSHDIIVIDGYCEWPDRNLRPICFARAERYVAPGGIVIVDDSWRYDADIRTNRARERRRFRSVGPCRPGVTTTDIYFY